MENLTLLQKNADSGDSQSQYELAAYYLTNDDIENALNWAKKSAIQENPDGLNILGILYESIILPSETYFPQSLDLYKKAVDLGSIKAMKNLTRVYLYTLGDEATAIKYLGMLKNNSKNSIEMQEAIAGFEFDLKKWNKAKESIASGDKIPLFPQTPRNSDKYIYDIHFLKKDADTICFTELKTEDKHGRTGQFYSFTKTDFYKAMYLFDLFKYGEIHVSELQPKKLCKLFWLFKYMEDE